MKVVNILDVTLTLAIAKNQPHKKPDSDPLHLNILTNHPPKIIKGLPSNIRKNMSNLSAYEITFNNSQCIDPNLIET